MIYRTLLIGACLFAGACSEPCKNISQTCIDVHLMPATGVSELDQVELWIDGTKRFRSAGARQSLPMHVVVIWPDGARSLMLTSFLTGIHNGSTAEVPIKAFVGEHISQEMQLTAPRTKEDMGSPDQDLRSPELPDLRTPELSDLRSPELPDLRSPGLPDLR